MGSKKQRCCRGQCKLNRILIGETQDFLGNASISQYWNSGFTEGRISGNNPAIMDDTDAFTFTQLDCISTEAAKVMKAEMEGLQNKNPDGDFVIAVCIPPSEKLIFTLFAILKLGAGYLPIDSTFPESRISNICKDCRPLLIISDSHSTTVQKFDAVKKACRVITTTKLFENIDFENEEKLTEVEEIESQSLKSPPERIAVILYTSGSSGEPKGVRITHRAIMNRLDWQWKTFPFSEDDRCCFKTNPTFVDSISEIFGTLLQGIPIVLCSKNITTNPNLFINQIKGFKITRVILIPSLFRGILQTVDSIGEDEGINMLSSVKIWICSGEPLKKDLLQLFFDHFPKDILVANLYGSTEVMGNVCFVTFSNSLEIHGKAIHNHIPVGFPISNCIIYLVDEQLNLVPEGETGEICVTGYNLAEGYVGTSDSKSFLQNPFTRTQGYRVMYKTGDFGHIGKTKNNIRTLVLEGRLDSQIKVRDQKVDINEIELTISQLEVVKKVIVLCSNPGKETQSLIAFIVTNQEVAKERVEKMLVSRLRSFEVPVVKIISNLPLLPSGKIDRQRLIREYESTQSEDNEESEQDWESLEIPSHKIPAAKALISVISEVTGTSTFDILHDLDSSFYNLGGTSLNSVQVLLKLKKQGYILSIAAFVSAKTIRETIEKIISPKAEGDEEEAEEDEGESTTTTNAPIAEKQIEPVCSVANDAVNKYAAETLVFDHADDVASIIGSSFSKKGDLEQYTKATADEFVALVHSMMKSLVHAGFSFVVRRLEDGKIVGASLNYDVYDQPQNVRASQGITYALELLDYIEMRQRVIMMGVAQGVDQGDNVYITEFMEEENLRRAQGRNFIGILTCNTNPLMHSICVDVHGYETLAGFAIRDYIAQDGTRPFLLAPETQKVNCVWKKLNALHSLE